MSSYPFPAAAPPQAATSSTDPTAVMGRRIGAWVVDVLLFLLIIAFVGPTPLNPLAEYYDTNDVPGVDCTVIEEANDVSNCAQIGDRLYFTEGSDAAIGFVAVLAAFLLYSFVQGATGRTPGKAVFGVKVVDEQGGTPGFGKSILRTVLW
ncbi:MAG: RDD family protein, partial [Acidimicrobiales bacterium]|nr:RDD family protein [Acidimicrobiales bacterium]